MKVPPKYRVNIYRNIFAAIGILVVFAVIFFGLRSEKTLRYAPFMGYGSVSVGGMTPQQAADAINRKLERTRVMIVFADQKKVFVAKDLGMAVDEGILFDDVRSPYRKILTKSDFLPRSRAVPVLVDNRVLASALEPFRLAAFVAPLDAKFRIENDQFVLEHSVKGYGIRDSEIASKLTSTILSDQSKLTLTLQARVLEPAVNDEDIMHIRPAVEAYLDNSYEVIARDKLYTARPFDIGTWLAVSKDKQGPRLVVREGTVENYVNEIVRDQTRAPTNEITTVYQSGRQARITQLGINGYRPNNSNVVAHELIASIKSGVDYRGKLSYEIQEHVKLQQSINDTLIRASYTYSIETWGSVLSDIGEFKAHVGETLGHASGWSSAGLRFGEVSNGGSFTVVLAEPARVAAFSSVCSAEYSCRVGRYVIINDERWRTATSSWNASGGSLRDYQHMVVNHETGHWLGFGHGYCSGPGLFAPVMQQQSISLQGCTPNPWPLADEIARVRR